MTRLLLFLFYSIFSISLSAQSMSFSPDTDLYGDATLENYNIFQIDIFNETQDSLQLSWKFISDTTPEEWEISLCDNVNCYGIIPPGGVMNPILDVQAFIKLDVNPGVTTGSGILTFLIFETNNTDVNQEIRFHISAGPVATSNVPDLVSKIFPNPSSDFLVIENQESVELFYNIINGTGQTVSKFSLSAGIENNIVTSNWPAGLYMINYSKDQKSYNSQKILITH